jgi:hypothetical protein
MGFLTHISLVPFLQTKEFFLLKGGLLAIFSDKKSRHTSYVTLTITTIICRYVVYDLSIS